MRENLNTNDSLLWDETRNDSNKEIIKSGGERSADGTIIPTEDFILKAHREGENNLKEYERLNSPEFLKDYSELMDMILSDQNDLRQVINIRSNRSNALKKFAEVLMDIERQGGSGPDLNIALDNLQSELSQTADFKDRNHMYYSFAMRLSEKIQEFVENYNLVLPDIDFSNRLTLGRTDSDAKGLQLLLDSAIKARKYELMEALGKIA